MAQVVKRKAAPGAMGATKRKAAGKLSKSDAARRLASAIENHMSELNLSDEEKNERVSRFAGRVNDAFARRARS